MTGDRADGPGPTRIGLCGLGSIGKSAARLLIDYRSGHEIVAAATMEPDVIGRQLNEVVGAANTTSVVVSASLDEVLAERPDVVVYSTGSFLEDTAPDVMAVARAGANLVSPCEELAFPFARSPDTAREIDEVAVSNGVTILGTGVNPGFVFDTLLATVSGVCWDINAVRGRRVVDVIGFGENIHARLGIGCTLEEFEEGHAKGTIAGHVGFPESIAMVCDRLGLELDGEVEEVFEPLIAASDAPTNYGAVRAGRTEGFVQRAIGRVDGEPRVELELVLHLRPHCSDLEPSDSIELDGTHPVRLTLRPGMDAILATSAVLVNSIPVVLNASPGLKSVVDLPSSAAWLTDLPRQLH